MISCEYGCLDCGNPKAIEAGLLFESRVTKGCLAYSGEQEHKSELQFQFTQSSFTTYYCSVLVFLNGA